jgi:hypothetical protein
MDEIESPESLQLRRVTSQLIARITADVLASALGLPPTDSLPSLKEMDLLPLMQHPDVGLVLNLLKISSESSYEIFQSLQSLITSEDSPELPEWTALSDQLSLNLDLLALMVTLSELLPSLPQVNKPQRHIILDMKASLLGNLGSSPLFPRILFTSSLLHLR